MYNEVELAFRVLGVAVCSTIQLADYIADEGTKLMAHTVISWYGCFHMNLIANLCSGVKEEVAGILFKHSLYLNQMTLALEQGLHLTNSFCLDLYTVKWLRCRSVIMRVIH